MSLNGALRANPSRADDRISAGYSDWYFAVSAIMFLSGSAIVALAAMKPRRNRLFHYITAGVVFVASIAYFTMGSDLGSVPIEVEFRGPGTRQIFYVRYIDWVITTPLLLLDLLLTAGTPTPTILFVILVDEIMIVTGLIGALIQSSYKWGYFTFAMLALFYVLYHLCFASLKHAAFYGADVRSVFLRCGALTSILWLLYPVAWGVSEGGNVIDTNGESIFYGILDVFAKPVFGALLIHGHRNIDPARLGIHIKDYDESDPIAHNRKARADEETHGTLPHHDAPANGPLAHEPKTETTTT